MNCADRYSSAEMRRIFSDENKFVMWRVLWYDLAEAEQRVGVNVSDEQLNQLWSSVCDVDIKRASEIESITHHDVMSHIKAYAEQCPEAAGIIHLGATSCYVTDNADVLRMRVALNLIQLKLSSLLKSMHHLAKKYDDLECLSYTHFQAAQPTTVGKRIAMWMQDLLIDYHQVTYAYRNMRMLGCRGATGTADSFLALVDGDENKARQIEKFICDRYSMEPFAVSGQTYTRKQDFSVLQSLSGIAQSASKFANDMRLLSHEGEIMEPFGQGQVGSSAMPYKRNPMKCERINALSRHVICNLQNVAITSATQWLERTLDDSANRRVVIPDMFLLTDGILNLYTEVIEGLVVDEDTIRTNLEPYKMIMNSERFMMYCVNEKGMDRQKIHEIIKEISSLPTAEWVDALNKNPYIADHLSVEEINRELGYDGPHYGMARAQVNDFLRQVEDIWRTEIRG